MVQSPSPSSAYASRKGVRHDRQKNSACKGWGSERQEAQTGTRETPVKSCSHSRHSSGKIRLKDAQADARALERKNDSADSGAGGKPVARDFQKDATGAFLIRDISELGR